MNCVFRIAIIAIDIMDALQEMQVDVLMGKWYTYTLFSYRR